MIYEVFRQERKGQPFQHAGSVEAADDHFADVYAREQYGRRGESTALWIVPRNAVIEIDEFVDELNRNYHRVDGYPLKEKLKEARERAGTAAPGPCGPRRRSRDLRRRCRLVLPPFECGHPRTAAPETLAAAIALMQDFPERASSDQFAGW